jgi:hypothetical protein
MSQTSLLAYFPAKSLIYIGAGDRDRTGMDFHPRDFKSLASANSATPAAQNIRYKKKVKKTIRWVCTSATKKAGARPAFFNIAWGLKVISS